MKKNKIKFPDMGTSDSGKPKVLNTADNFEELLKSEKLAAMMNMMTWEYELIQNGLIIQDHDISRSILISLASIHNFPRIAIDDHFKAVARKNEYHPVEKWLSTEEWDGTNRVDAVINCLNSANPEIANFVLKRWLVGCVASLYESNFSSKLVPVLRGEQSFKKTAFIERIATVVPKCFLPGAELNPDHKDSVLSVIRSWIVELGELERTTKNNQGSLKAFITKSSDTIRPPYSRTDINKRRQTHLIATVNEMNFLKDHTGNTRYAVIELKEVPDIDTINEILGWKYDPTGKTELVDPQKLKQFWLEIKYLYDNQYGWMLTKNESILVAQESERYEEKGIWYSMLSDHLDNCETYPKEWLTTTQICNQLKIENAPPSIVGKSLAALSRINKIERRLINGKYEYSFPIIIS
ncbi:virulence protein [Vibrio sp. Y2-5]|uniref:VapE domain-containing protein n=1 Tax=Vibrio sp. Y2-5 TaxID=2743977 RepID=UPI0016607F77|nr:VapE domain-containing protein [Vibrio sp. Y2-5]MBD0788435.1 virulence protein [Vibrio sp. Y2-5]